MNTYPNNIDFIMADDVIEEKNTNKLTIIGYYAGDNILFEKGEKPGKALGQLSILAKFKDGSGDYNTCFKLLSPSDKELFNKEEKKTKKENESIVMGLKISPFKIDEFGEFKYILKLDNEEYIYRFTISAK